MDFPIPPFLIPPFSFSQNKLRNLRELGAPPDTCVIYIIFIIYMYTYIVKYIYIYIIIILIINIHIYIYIYIPGHALHEKGLQRQKGASPLVSSQERRALAVPLINRG